MVSLTETAAAQEANSTQPVAQASATVTETSSAADAKSTPPKAPVDPCLSGAVVSSPTRPMWNGGAATTQCGVLEMDFGWLGQPVGHGVQQRMLLTSFRFGLTPKLDIRWGQTLHISQTGGGEEGQKGIGDQCMNLTYNIMAQRHWMPAMAISYGIKFPLANPKKGFDSGYVDHQFVYIASRDVGRTHLDFNAVGMLDGEATGHIGAAQFGLAITRPITKKFSLIFENFGGPQPEDTERFGASQLGGTYNIRPWLVVDGAYMRSYTVGAPRQMVLIGITYAVRPFFRPPPKRVVLARLMGR